MEQSKIIDTLETYHSCGGTFAFGGSTTTPRGTSAATSTGDDEWNMLLPHESPPSPWVPPAMPAICASCSMPTASSMMDLNIHPIIKNITWINMLGSNIKKIVFIIYLLEDEHELSLGMLHTFPTYL